MLELISRARSKDWAVPLERALIGVVHPIWMVGPRRPRYKERERGRGTDAKVGTPLLSSPTSRSDLGKRKANEKLHQQRDVHHDDRIRHSRPRPIPQEARRRPLPASPIAADGQRLPLPPLSPSVSLSCGRSGMNYLYILLRM